MRIIPLPKAFRRATPGTWTKHPKCNLENQNPDPLRRWVAAMPQRGSKPRRSDVKGPDSFLCP